MRHLVVSDAIGLALKSPPVFYGHFSWTALVASQSKFCCMLILLRKCCITKIIIHGNKVIFFIFYLEIQKELYRATMPKS